MAEQSNKPSLEKVYWKDIRDDVLKVNPEFVKLVDELDPAKKYPLYVVTYPYGSVIAEKGKFYLPTKDGELVTMSSNRIPASVKEDFKYSGTEVPAGIVLENSFELFIESGGRILPLFMQKPGFIFALWSYLDTGRVFHPPQIFSLTAGARSICMVPNIGDYALHKNLKRDFNVRTTAPKELLKHWHLFREITQHPAAKCSWRNKLLLFPDSWLDLLKNNTAFRLFMLESAWSHTAYWRNKIFYDFAFSYIQAIRHLKPNPYLLDTFKHLFAIGIGVIPGFGVATDNSVAPIDILQKIYVESYGLKKYVPTIMHPVEFCMDKADKPIYYSMQFPTTIEFSPKSRKLSSTLEDLSELKYITDVFLEEVVRGSLAIEDTVFGDLAENVAFEFYHNKPDRNGEIHLTKDMVQNDPSLVNYPKKYKGRSFADAGTFVRGCIQVVKKNG